MQTIKFSWISYNNQFQTAHKYTSLNEGRPRPATQESEAQAESCAAVSVKLRIRENPVLGNSVVKRRKMAISKIWHWKILELITTKTKNVKTFNWNVKMIWKEKIYLKLNWNFERYFENEEQKIEMETYAHERTNSD